MAGVLSGQGQLPGSKMTRFGRDLARGRRSKGALWTSMNAVD